MNLLFGSYPQPIQMLHKNTTPPLPNTEYVQAMLLTLKSNIRAITNSKNDFITYFTNALSREKKKAPKECEILYKQLDTFGASFIKCLEEFITLIEPTLKTTNNLNEKRSELAKTLDEYQKRIVIVRKEMTEANIAAEGEKLQAFSKSLTEFNHESNDYKHYILKLYLSACFQLEQGMASTLSLLNKAIESPEEIPATQEEKELDDYMHQLNEQIAAKHDKEEKAKAETAAKAQKEKEAKEKAEQQKIDDKKEEAEKDKEEKEEIAEEKKEIKVEQEENNKTQQQTTEEQDTSNSDNEKEDEKSEPSDNDATDDKKEDN